jgi:Na+-driven multidrug efflux pump
MIISMFVLYSYQLINTFFIAGLGSDANAAMGYITPFTLIWLGLS